MDYRIRQETPEDQQAVEEMIREAFWNLYVPGCSEHYLARRLRVHEDFVKDLDLVLETDGQVVGNIMYTKARLARPDGREMPILTFGPLCVRKGFQRQGLGKRLMEESFRKAMALGYSVVVIFGNPGNYVSSGFKSCSRFSISLEDGSYPTAMLVRELVPQALPEGPWRYIQSEAMDIDEAEAEKYDQGLEPMERKSLPCQEEFFILSQSKLR